MENEENVEKVEEKVNKKAFQENIKYFNKEKILEAYLNTVYLGFNSNGIETAARAYFNKELKDLTFYVEHIDDLSKTLIDLQQSINNGLKTNSNQFQKRNTINRIRKLMGKPQASGLLIFYNRTEKTL